MASKPYLASLTVNRKEIFCYDILQPHGRGFADISRQPYVLCKLMAE